VRTARLRVAGHLVRAFQARPAGQTRQDREIFRTVRDQLLVEIGSGRELDDLIQLNTLL
jgi:putative transposase